MDIQYSKGWFRQQKRHLELYDVEKALRLYADRKQFTVIVNDKKPYCFINFNNKFVYVGFLDDLKREYLKYSFWEVTEGEIFLKEVQFWDYDGVTDDKINSTRYRFTPDGEFGKEIKDYVTKESEILTAKNKLDVSVLYERYPEFGNYSAIIKKEREMPNTRELA